MILSTVSSLVRPSARRATAFAVIAILLGVAANAVAAGHGAQSKKPGGPARAHHRKLDRELTFRER